MPMTVLEELFSLRGQVALVTGASGGIGQALASGLAAAGAFVILSGRSRERLGAVYDTICTAGGSALVVPADLDDPQVPAQLAAQVLAVGGKRTLLVNCAGMNQRLAISETTPAIYDQIMATNLRGAFFLSQALLPLMVRQGGGKIIHVGSLTSAVALEHVSVYGMTKSALAQLTKTMAVEWAGHNIQVNCLAPGFIATDLTVQLWDDPARRAWMLARLPIKRAGQPADLVGLAIYLASRASDYMTGQTLYVDGGFLAGSQW